MSLLVLVALVAVIPQSQSMQSHASDKVQVEPVCKLDLTFAKRVLDAYEVVRHDIPRKALENESELVAFTSGPEGSDVSAVLAALGFASASEWYQCLTALAYAYRLASVGPETPQPDLERDDSWDTSLTSGSHVVIENLATVEALKEEEVYRKILHTLVSITERSSGVPGADR
jgi:hypothetical protein